MAREKSPLTREMIYTLGRILTALTTSTNLTEDVIRTLCRQARIAAIGQGELSGYLREFRDQTPTPKEKLAVLAEILPDGLLLAMLLLGQEWVNAQVSNVYQEDAQVKMSLQNTQAVLENERSARNTKDVECERLRTELASAQRTISVLTDENSLLRGRLMERDETKQKKSTAKEKRSAKNAGRTAVKVAIAKKLIAAEESQAQAEPGHCETASAESFEAVALVHEKGSRKGPSSENSGAAW